MRQDLKNLSQTQNTCTPPWKDIPYHLQLIILSFLSPIEALPGISTSKDNLNSFGQYIIQRLRHENLSYMTVHTGNCHNLAIRQDGTLIAWGLNDFGQLGLGHTKNQYKSQHIDPKLFQNKTIQSIHAGFFHTLTRCTDNSIFAWGHNATGQLGLGHTDDQFNPHLVAPHHFQDKTIQSIQSGNNFNIALGTNGTLFSWGNNVFGQLGLGHDNSQYTPQLINSNYFQGKPIQSIYTGSSYTLVRCADNSLFAWGDNEYGQLLGQGHSNVQYAPQYIPHNHFQGKPIHSIYAGDNHTLALCTDNTLFGWGDNEYGQLGLGHTNEQHTPQQINPNHFQGKTIQSISTKYRHNLALCTDGTLFSWGKDNVQNNDQNTPQPISKSHFQGKTIQSIHVGNYHVLALSTDGTLFSWGSNYYGQLGLGHNEDQDIPQPFPDPLERAFRSGHQRLNLTSFFSNTSVDPTTRFLSGSILHPNETDQSRTESTTTGMEK